MALSRANVESVLIGRVGAWLTAAGLDGTTASGTNASLNDPIGRAMRQLGFTVTDPMNVADADLAFVTPPDYDELFDLAELRAMRSAYQNFTKVNISLGPRSESFGQLRDGMLAAIKTKEEEMVAAGYSNAGSLTGGVLALEFQEQPLEES